MLVTITERRRFQPSPLIRGVRACLRCCCPTPGPEVYRDRCRPSVPLASQQAVAQHCPLGQHGPAVLLRRRGRAALDFWCLRELDILPLYARSCGMLGRGGGPPTLP